MFGGWKFNKNSEILREAEAGKSNADSSVSSVNDGLFLKINDAEHHAKAIIQTGQTQYIDGIKQNVLDSIYLWLAEEGSNVFTLYGKMGCGKSFFSAHLYGHMEQEKERYDTVAFSSQQIYRDTTQVRNMLLSLAHQLFLTVPACSDYFTRHPLDSESIASLTEEVLVASFEGAQLTKTVFIIIDGLDEYPRYDCEAFLETLGRLRARLNRRVKIFFTSRPEDYIMSEMICDSERCSYHIEQNREHSYEDCSRFIEAKCRKAELQIDEALKKALIQKSECSLKYLECFFNEVSLRKISVTADFIDSLPMGLSHYYRDQLVRYFGDESLGFYQSKIVPLLELLCVAWRPITIAEASDILGCRERDIQDIINRSGTLLWRNNRYVMLYQSESIREFLIDDRCCPEKYRIDRDNGHRRILDRLTQMMDGQEELESNMYLFHCAVEHIIGQERVTNEQWALLIRVVACYADKADVMFKIAQRLLEKNVGEITAFLRRLHGDTQITPLLQDACSIRLIAVAVTERQTDKLLSVADILEGPEQFDFFVTYSRARIHRVNKENNKAKALLEPRRSLPGDDELSLFRHSCYMDELCRVYRSLNCITWEENTDLHILVLRETEQLTQKYQRIGGPISTLQQRYLAVSYGQLGALCELLEKQADSALREVCGQKICAILQLPAQDSLKSGFFLVAADVCHRENLRLTKICQQRDAFSDSRIYDLHYAFYFLGILYFRKDFPGYNPDKALQYFEDCLAAIMEIALRPESHERYIQVVVKIYNKLTTLYLQEASYAAARKYLEEATRMRELRLLYHPSVDSEFSRCYSYEQEADIVKAEAGIDSAEPYYLTAVEHYQKCCQKYTDRFVLRSCQVVYFKLAKAFKLAGNLQKYITYIRLELKEIEKVYSRYPSASLRWDWAVSMEYLAEALRKTDSAGTVAQRAELLQTALSFELELAQAEPENKKYRCAPCVTYHYLLNNYLETDQIAQAQDCLDKALALCRDIAGQIPEYYGWLDIPIRMLLLLSSKLTDADTLHRYFEEIYSYLRFVIPYRTDEDFLLLTVYFLDSYAKHIDGTQGIEAAEPYYLELTEKAKAYAALHPSENNFMLAISGYSNLYLGYSKKKYTKKAFDYLQEELAAVEGYIKQLPTSVDLRKFRGILYKTMADMLKDSSHEKNLDAAVDLYKLCMQQNIILWKEVQDSEKKDTYIKMFSAAYRELQAFLQSQEHVVKIARSFAEAQKETLLIYVRRLVNAYKFLSELRLEDAQKKLEQYTALLEELGGQ